MRIMNNLPALTAFNALNSTNKSLQETIKSLSTGLRINSASDDAAGFAVSEKMRSQIRGLDIALKNSQDGISLLQTAEGALSQTNGMLQRMRDLSVQASNDSLTSNDRQYIQLEIDQLKDEINRIAGTTQFNKKRILDGSSGALWASSDPGVRAVIHGGLTRTDNFGQKVSSEGNYRIEVTASPGQAQVQKSNIFSVAEITDEHTVTREKDYIIDLSKATDNSETPASYGNGWMFTRDNDGNTYLSIYGSGKFNLTGTAPADMYVAVEGTASDAVVFMSDVNITTSAERPAFCIKSGAKVDMYLAGNNILKHEKSEDPLLGQFAGLAVSPKSELTISSLDGDFSESGTLTAEGGPDSAGIGGNGAGLSLLLSGDIGTITINGGTIVAKGDTHAPGIGSSSISDAWGNITINGGNITAEGGNHQGRYIFAGAGIGSADRASNNMNITITGGTVNALGGTHSYYAGDSLALQIGAAGIGGGILADSGHIRIAPGVYPNAVPGTTEFVMASASPPENGAAEADPIGHGWGGNPDNDDVVRNAPITRPAAREIPEKPKITYEETIPQEADLKTLDELSQFHSSDGVSLLSRPQTLTITQGNGQSANITLYATDTIYDVADKINDAIANQLGQGCLTDNPAKFCTVSDGTEGTSESVYGTEPIYEYDPIYDDKQNIIGYTPRKIGYSVSATMLIRSAIPGKDGELYFSGDEDLLNALGLNTIQESSESRFTASVYDAHSGAKVNTMTAESNEFKSIIPPEIDIDIDPMTTAISSSWDENSKRYIFTGGEKYSAFIHLKDNGITFHTGANMGEDFSIQLGDMSCSALGINRVNVTNRESASRSIGIIDRAISRVSSQRAKIGAYINGLEHTMSNLTTTNTSLTEAESRIRDTDMAAMMMQFVRLQILNQSGTSMLAQANQLPQSVLSLLQ